MVNLMQRAASFLGSKLQGAAVAGRTVTYRRGQLVSEPLQAVNVGQGSRVMDEQGFVTSLNTDDWQFVTSELVIRGETIEPRAGDRIEETLNGIEIIYEVVPIDTRPCFERIDTSGLLMTVHTNRIR